MYLTDYREACLQDVITQLEPDLFKRVTGLTVKDFELLASIGVFNESLMNDAIFKFRRYENASLEYTGINRHEGEKIGGWNTVASKDDLDAIYGKEADLDDSIKVGDFVWFNGKKVVVDKLNDSKIWLRDNGRRMDPVALARALESGSLSRTKPELELVKPEYKQQVISFDAANEPVHPYTVKSSKEPETVKPVTIHAEPETAANIYSEKIEAPKGGWSTDPRDPHSNPRVRVGERYKTNDYGICTVSELRPGKVYMKTSKGKVVIFMYPNAFVNKKVIKV